MKYIVSLVQGCSNSIANGLELLQSCTKPSIWNRTQYWKQQCNDKGRTRTRIWTPKKMLHTVCWEQALGCLIWGNGEKKRPYYNGSTLYISFTRQYWQISLPCGVYIVTTRHGLGQLNFLLGVRIIVLNTLHKYLISGCLWTVELKLYPLITMIPDKVGRLHYVSPSQGKNQHMCFIRGMWCKPHQHL